MQKLWKSLSKIVKKESRKTAHFAEHSCSSSESLKCGLFDNQQVARSAIRANLNILRQLDKGASALPA